MPNIQNYQVINSDIENVNVEENLEIIYPNIRWNAFKNFISNTSKLCILSCFAALIDAYIQNKLTNDKFDDFSEFFKRTKTYLSWGLAAMVFSILIDKNAFHYVDAVIKDIKELITGQKYFTNEEKDQIKIKALETKIVIIQENYSKDYKELTLFKKNILEIVKRKPKKFEIKNFIKANANYNFEANNEIINIEHVNNLLSSNKFDKQKCNSENGHYSKSENKLKSPKM